MRILRKLSEVISAVWRNPRIQDSIGFLENQVRSGWQMVFSQRRRIREFRSWFGAAFGAREKDLLFLLLKISTKPGISDS